MERKQRSLERTGDRKGVSGKFIEKLGMGRYLPIRKQRCDQPGRGVDQVNKIVFTAIVFFRSV